MKELKFDTGRVTYALGEQCEVSFNPTDINFMEKLYNAFEELESRNDAREREVKKTTDPRAVFELGRRYDAEMREIIDGIFSEPVSDALFGDMNSYAISNGLPLWTNFLFTLMDEMDESMVKEKRLTNPRLNKYLKKYHK